jgi:uncharacterized protein
MPTAPATTRPNWRLVALFYALSFGWVSLIALVMHAFGARMDGGTQLVFQLTVAFFYMPAPLVAALICERVAHRRPLITHTFDDFGAKLPRLLLTFLAVVAGIYCLDVALSYVLGNLLHLPGVGTLTFTSSGILANLKAYLPPGTKLASGTMPPALALYPIGMLAAFSAGLTINGLFAFGEEYGWRGFLMDELRSIGVVRANLLIGVLWGLWHAPIILMGFNYGKYALPGILMMCVFTTPLSFVMWYARDYTGSLLAPAILHGAFNGFAGFFLLFLANPNPLVRAPVGVVGAVGLAIVAAVLGHIATNRKPAERPAEEEALAS